MNFEGFGQMIAVNTMMMLLQRVGQWNRKDYVNHALALHHLTAMARALQAAPNSLVH